MNGFWKNIRMRITASALAFLFVASSAITLTHTGLNADALAGLLPAWAFQLFAAAYGAAGLLMIVGIGTDRLNVEAAGCALVTGGIGSRIVAVIAVLPFSIAVAFNTLLLAVFAIAYIERFRQCVQGLRPVMVGTEIKLEDHDGSE
jgi:hypothetical protein